MCVQQQWFPSPARCCPLLMRSWCWASHPSVWWCVGLRSEPCRHLEQRRWHSPGPWHRTLWHQTPCDTTELVGLNRTGLMGEKGGGGVRTKPVRVGQNTACEGGSEHKWSGWARTKLVNVESEQNRSGWGQNKFDRVGQNRPGYGGSKQNWSGCSEQTWLGWVWTQLVRVGQNRTGQGGSEHNWSGWVRTQLVSVESEQNRSGWGQNKFDRVGQNSPGYGGSEQTWLWWVRTELVRVGQNRPGYGGSEQNWLWWVRTDLVMVHQNRTGQGVQNRPG